MPLGTPLNDGLQNWRLDRRISPLKYIPCCCSTIDSAVMCGLIPHYGEEMAGGKFDFQPNHTGRPEFSSAM